MQSNVSNLSHTRIVVSLPPGLICRLPTGKLPPEWMRTSFIQEDASGPDIDRVWLPIAVFGNEKELILSALYDGVFVMQDQGHAYAPASWIMRERRGLAAQIKTIANRMIELAAEDAE